MFVIVCLSDCAFLTVCPQLSEALANAAADKADADKRIAILDAQNKNATDEIDRLKKQLDTALAAAALAKANADRDLEALKLQLKKAMEEIAGLSKAVADLKVKSCSNQSNPYRYHNLIHILIKPLSLS